MLSPFGRFCQVLTITESHRTATRGSGHKAVSLPNWRNPRKAQLLKVHSKEMKKIASSNKRPNTSREVDHTLNAALPLAFFPKTRPLNPTCLLGSRLKDLEPATGQFLAHEMTRAECHVSATLCQAIYEPLSEVKMIALA